MQEKIHFFAWLRGEDGEEEEEDDLSRTSSKLNSLFLGRLRSREVSGWKLIAKKTKKKKKKAIKIV